MFKKILALALIFMALPSSAYAALSQQTVWEVRSTGANTNGGGFVAGSSGTDYSQQNSPQYSLTNGVTNGTTTIATVSAATAMVGNIAYIAGGTGSITGGWYQITAATAGTSITVDRATGLTTGTGVTVNVGGALADLNALNTVMVSSNKAFIKATATYTTATGYTLSGSGGTNNANLQNQLIGYTTTRGDNGQVTLQATAGSITVLNITGSSWQISNIIADCNSQTSCTSISLGYKTITNNVKAKNFTSVGIASGSTCIILNSESTGGTSAASAAMTVNNSSLAMFNNVHDNSTSGIVANGTAGYIQFNLVTNNTGASSDGIYLQYSVWQVTNNIVYNSGRDGIRNNGDTTPLAILNNVLVSNAGYGLNFSNGAGFPAMPQTDGNAYYGNTLGNRHNMDDTGTANALNAAAPYTNTHDIVLSSSPFINSGTGNFGLNSTGGAGGALKQTGLPSAWPGNASTVGYPDYGAVQAQSSAAAAGGAYVFGE